MSLFVGLNAQMNNDSVEIDLMKIKNWQQSMSYEKIIQYVNSAQLTDAFALKSKAVAQASLGFADEATNTMNLAASLYPRDLNLLSDLADIAKSIGDEDLTLKYLNLATAIRPAPDLMYKKAEILYSKKLNKESIALIDSILSDHPISSVVRLKARNLAALKEYKHSAHILMKQIENDSTDYLSFRQLVKLCLTVDYIQIAQDQTDKYLLKDSLNTEILNLNAKAHYLNNEYSKAVTGYKKLESLGVKFDYDQNFFAALSFYRASDTLIYDAFNYMQKADSLAEGQYYPLKYYLGQMAENTGKISESIRYYSEAAAIIQPDTIQLAQVFNKLGKMQMLSRNPQEAIKSHKTALKYKADDTTAIISIGLACAYLKEYEKALPYFEEIIRLLPDTVHDAYSNLAVRQIEYLKEKIKNKSAQNKR